jgi:hypothetical protein
MVNAATTTCLWIKWFELIPIIQSWISAWINKLLIFFKPSAIPSRPLCITCKETPRFLHIVGVTIASLGHSEICARVHHLRITFRCASKVNFLTEGLCRGAVFVFKALYTFRANYFIRKGKVSIAPWYWSIRAAHIIFAFSTECLTQILAKIIISGEAREAHIGKAFIALVIGVTKFALGRDCAIIWIAKCTSQTRVFLVPGHTFSLILANFLALSLI